MKRTHRITHQGGAALVVGMILLAIITLLAVVGMNISTSELQVASSEQLRLRAFQAAAAGLERGVVEVPDLPAVRCASYLTPLTQVADADPEDQYELDSRFRGESQLADSFGRNFKSFHFTVVSEGVAPRNTRVEHVQGAFLVNKDESGSFSPIGATLTPPPCP
jgi:Tfp pilus assembly protein PilX